MVRFWIHFEGKSTRFADRLGVEWEEEEESRKRPRFLALATGRMELPFPETRQARAEAGWGWERVRLGFRHVNFDTPVECLFLNVV